MVPVRSLSPSAMGDQGKSPLTCVVVEDQRMFLDLLVRMLRLQDGLRVVATARTVEEGIKACKEHRPDLLILDVCLSGENGEHGENGVMVAEALAEVNPNARLIVLSAQAKTFVCPSALRPMLHAVVDKIDAYESLGLEIAELLPAPPIKRCNLTAREQDVLRLLGLGLTSAQISEVMSISANTVETHRRNISLKLGLKGAELIRYATLQVLQAD